MPPAAPTPPAEAVLREAFLWSEKRTVSKTGTFGMHGNDYEVDAELAGQRVELVFDPLDLTELEVRSPAAGWSIGGPAADPPSRSPESPRRARCRAARRPGSTTSAWSLPAARGSLRSGSTTATCRRPAARTTRRQRDEHRSAYARIGGSPRRRSPRSWHRRCCSAPAPISRRSRGSAGSFRARARCRLWRGRRRQDRRRPRGDRRARPEPAHADLPPQPGDRRARVCTPRSSARSATPPGFTPRR